MTKPTPRPEDVNEHVAALRMWIKTRWMHKRSECDAPLAHLAALESELARLRDDRHARDLDVAEAVREACLKSEGAACQCDDVYLRMGRAAPDCNVHDAATRVRALDLDAVLEGVP